MFKTRNYDDIADKPAEVLAKSHTSDTAFYSFVDDFHNQIRKITENTLEKTIAKTYGNGEIPSFSNCPDCGSPLKHKGSKKKLLFKNNINQYQSRTILL